MLHDGLDCDIESILHCRENEEFDILQRLSVFCQDFHSKVAASINNYLIREKEYADKNEAITESIAQLHGLNKDKVTERDSIVLQQKVADKKMTIALKQQTKLREEINESKCRKESIALQMVDLMQGLEDGKRERKERWNAIKMACWYYKENLDFHIDLKNCDDHDSVKVTFFRRKNPDRDNYYVNLLNYKNTWKVRFRQGGINLVQALVNLTKLLIVEHIEPALKETHLDTIKTVIDMTKALEVPDIVAFLCTLRNIFSKHYFKE